MRYWLGIIFFIATLSPLTAGAEEATTTPVVQATSTVDLLRARIEEKNKQIAEVEAEIAGYQKEIQKTGEQARTLANQVKAQNAAIASLSGDIRVTKKRIEASVLKLEELNIAIGDKEEQIIASRDSLAELIRTMHERESQSLLEILLAHASLSTFFSDLESAETLSGSVENQLEQLHMVRAQLAAETDAREAERQSYVEFQKELADRKSIEENTKKEKDALLKETKNREAAWQEQLRVREALRASLESEIDAIENDLRKLIDPNSLPPAKSGVLSWPVLGAMLTQSFGNTIQARILYDGKPHNGIDIRARSGTPIMAAADGEVIETGNSDLYPRCLSYGKWVLIRHANNLSTLYAHLSLIKVSKGDIVKRGDTIAYSGYTGYTVPRGPAGAHLHFTVYDSNTVKFGPSSKTNSTCEFLPFGGYLNPLAYL